MCNNVALELGPSNSTEHPWHYFQPHSSVHVPIKEFKEFYEWESFVIE